MGCGGIKGMVTSMWWQRGGRMTVAAHPHRWPSLAACMSYQHMMEKPSGGGVEGGSKKIKK
jgi:hypothetical protein